MSDAPQAVSPVAFAPTGDGRTGMVLCRGCCCGDPHKHPGTDHQAQLARLRTFAAAHPATASLRTSDCLGPCAHANVVVVRPSPGGRRAGGRPAWFGLVRDEQAVALFERWVAAGGPGIAPLPDLLGLHRIPAPRPAGSTARALKSGMPGTDPARE